MGSNNNNSTKIQKKTSESNFDKKKNAGGGFGEDMWNNSKPKDDPKPPKSSEKKSGGEGFDFDDFGEMDEKASNDSQDQSQVGDMNFQYDKGGAADASSEGDKQSGVQGFEGIKIVKSTAAWDGFDDGYGGQKPAKSEPPKVVSNKQDFVTGSSDKERKKSMESNDSAPKFGMKSAKPTVSTSEGATGNNFNALFAGNQKPDSARNKQPEDPFKTAPPMGGGGFPDFEEDKKPSKGGFADFEEDKKPEKKKTTKREEQAFGDFGDFGGSKLATSKATPPKKAMGDFDEGGFGRETTSEKPKRNTEYNDDFGGWEEKKENKKSSGGGGFGGFQAPPSTRHTHEGASTMETATNRRNQFNQFEFDRPSVDNRQDPNSSAIVARSLISAKYEELESDRLRRERDGVLSELEGVKRNYNALKVEHDYIKRDYEHL
mmetsp:Transcript_33291/g.30233  ORF Transcript_33291/g.30233 Transcript_33291/m.30233 type:complete len:431 (+) Transcript_33291:1418-2710(+)|eukprot:CAMPEP_0114578144 /NCGR_PEP_ID=MMETSP0125-20121206/2721_1 /TAXON_ID=485358 ORGANISM="Aristerostoma sp., Strain ATCC 50986" /NCGR_SAMPLE_ID=MMETSP0125 /ASSEMBLY_ACC=CAM_ASM_000245 /LENGTH=430 /DNA_ID=CAMNT_0001767995 /DNA_START=1352 /DNA_END=2644 /DNA_ORIENTATION=+